MIVRAKPGDILEIDWRDSYTSTAWVNKFEVIEMHDADEVKCKTVGYLLKTDKHFTTVAQSIATHNDDVDNTMTIPTGMIYHYEKLKGAIANGGSASKGSN